MHDSALACGLQRRAHRATQTCQSPLRGFQAASISSDLKDIWIWKSADNTSPHITVKPVTEQRRWEGRGGERGCFPPFMSTDKRGGWRTQLSANQTPLPLTRRLKAAASFQLLAGVFPRVHLTPWREKTYLDVCGSDISSQIEASVEKKHIFYALNKKQSNLAGLTFCQADWKRTSQDRRRRSDPRREFSIWICAETHKRMPTHIYLFQLYLFVPRWPKSSGPHTPGKLFSTICQTFNWCAVKTIN